MSTTNSYSINTSGVPNASGTDLGSAGFATNPSHYGSEGDPPPIKRDPPVQVIELIEALDLPYADGNIIKYVSRWRNKNGIEDLKKAKWYLDRLIEGAEEGQ